MNRQSLAVAIVACLATTSNAIWAHEDEFEQNIFSNSQGSDDQGLESMAGEEGSEALYYDPEEQVIYEILTEAEVQ